MNSRSKTLHTSSSVIKFSSLLLFSSSISASSRLSKDEAFLEEMYAAAARRTADPIKSFGEIADVDIVDIKRIQCRSCIKSIFDNVGIS
mmetsp:Transcript_48361/g.54823  ORF Transcript_48361/g.54823 Transcript_48361/m.54823 type:complete len:89 (+) Transcript_48361:734-1000(+)